MRNTELFSRQWCEVVFEGRNKAYGAYVIRKETGRRYRRVMYVFLSILMVALTFGATLGYVAYTKVKEMATEVQAEVKQLRPLEARDGFERKRVSAGRAVSRVITTPGGKTGAPTIVDEAVTSSPIGIDGPDDSKVVPNDDLTDHDIHHNAGQTDLPVEGPQLTAPQVVEEMPQFPGGLIALSQYLDEHIVFSGGAQRRGVRGVIEVSFVVQRDGSVSDVRITKHLDDPLEHQIISVIQNMPKWKPGRRGGVPSPVMVTVPVWFNK